MVKFGITERGDAGLDTSWVRKLSTVDGAIIITKDASQIIDELVLYQRKLILHLTCTGYGSTIVEPNVPNVNETLITYHRLIEAGFPVKQVVLRLDPIIPTKKGIARASDVLTRFALDTSSNTMITRVRYSFLDMYPHVRSRFELAGLPDPYSGSFTASTYMQEQAIRMINLWRGHYEFESCAEDTPDKQGCISQLDYNILGINAEAFGKSIQRSNCLCAASKTELLDNRDQCFHGCQYCYWKGAR